MVDSHPTGPATPPAGPTSLFDRAQWPDAAFCEAFDSPGHPRGHWQSLTAALDSIGFEGLRQRQDRVRRMRHEDGAAYNPFNDPSGRAIPWALELIPQPITASEWSRLETGLIQRATLLDKILADAYGPQHLMKNRHLPPALIYANPNFLHACHGLRPAGDRQLTFYAADLYRGPDGRFKVLQDHTSHPAGLGYALENRIVISRVFAGIYHQTQIRRLAPFFHAFHRAMAQLTASGRENPDIVLLSPGPDSRIYFEHAILSRYLGYTLVEGQDLTVRNGRVFLKKLAGLEPVEAVFRHIPDRDCDPLALRLDSAGGVAGLIQVCREGGIAMVNPIGSALAQTPALGPFLAPLCRVLLGEDLLLESHPAWWCGTADGLNHVLEHLQEMTLLPAMGGPAAPVTDPAAAVRGAPHDFLARTPLQPGAVPVWTRDGVETRPALLRVFACATEQGYAVMPGGLGITATDDRSLTTCNPHQQQSKDVWVISDQPVEPFSLMGGLEAAVEFSRGGDLPSRVADHLLWLGRYLERAEGSVRLLRAVVRRLSGEARPEDIPELPFLLNLMRTRETLPATPEGGGGVPLFHELTGQLHDALYRPDQNESVAHSLEQVRETARNVRDRLSLDAWRAINNLERLSDQMSGDPLEDLNDILFTLSAFSGLAMESMTRGLGWRFMDMGRRVERAMSQAGLIRASLSQLCSEQKSALEALLEVCDSIMTYRARYRAAFQISPVVDLLLVDETNPKSIAFQLSRLAAHVDHLPRQAQRRYASTEERMTLKMLTAMRLLDLSDLRCEGQNNSALLKTADFLETLEQQLMAFSRQISAHYLSRVPTTPHYTLKQDDPSR